MDKATKAIKRGSIRLKSYSEINLILSDLNDMRSCSKTSVKAHQMFIEDLIKWGHQESNETVKNSFSLLTELNLLWTEIHNEFFENLKKFRHQFELILENEHMVDKARNNVSNCEQIETKLKKDLKRASSKSSFDVADEVGNIGEKLREAQRALDFAKYDVSQKENENKVIKLIRIKEGLKKLTESYMSLSQKCNVIMQAQKIIVNELPDGSEISQEMQFAGECKAKHAIIKAKTVIQALGCSSNAIKLDSMALEYEAPPPYSPFYSSQCTSSNQQSDCDSLPSTSGARSDEPVNWWQSVNSGRTLIDRGGCSNEPKTYVCCKCSSQMISDHRYILTPDPEMQLVTAVQNTRLV